MNTEIKQSQKLIAIPYIKYQDEPSRPIRHLVEVMPKKQFTAELKRLFIEHVCSGANPDDIRVLYGSIDRPHPFCDIVVEWRNNDMYLLLTYVEQN